MAKIFRSRFTLTKRYKRFSNICVYFNQYKKKPVRFGYKLYQKIFKKYKPSGRTIRINVRKPRIAMKRKTSYGKALEFKEKFSYILNGIHASKLQRYCRLSRAKSYSPTRALLSNLEMRLDLALYKSNFVYGPKINYFLIESGCVEVNGKVKLNRNYKLRVNDVVSLKLPISLYPLALKHYRERVSKKLVFVYSPNYIEISYKTLKFIIYKEPKESEVFYPFNYAVSYFYRLYPKLFFVIFRNSIRVV
jgi:ribosomal protein S4